MDEIKEEMIKEDVIEEAVEDVMALPRFYGLVRVVFQIIAVLGCLGGALVILDFFNRSGGRSIERLISTSAPGILGIVLSLMLLGLAYCFLAMVKAQIDSRNAIVSYTSLKTANLHKESENQDVVS